MNETLVKDGVEAILARLKVANDAFSKIYPGDTGARQPVHTVYGGAQLFKFDTVQKVGKLAQKSFQRWAPDFVKFAHTLRLPGSEHLSQSISHYDGLVSGMSRETLHAEFPHVWLANEVFTRVNKKLAEEPIEDYRIDFEDGYGNRTDEEEDQQAKIAAAEVALAMERGTLPPFIGIRLKPLTEELKRRSVRTLEIFLSSLLEKTGGKLPENFLITLPKVIIKEQVTAFDEILCLLERANDLPERSLKIEFMIEQAQAFINDDGECTLRSIVRESQGRCFGMNLGTYDLTASFDVTATHQGMDHPACNFARHMMKAATAGTGIFLADGGTNIIPVEPHKGDNLSEEQIEENAESIYRAWKLSYDQISNSLLNGFYQGTDLHPAQLPIRYAACYAFFLDGLDAASGRLKLFTQKAAQATLLGDVFDDAATGQGLLNYFLRALNCGAISLDDVTSTGLTLDEIRSKSFVQIVQGRRNK